MLQVHPGGVRHIHQGGGAPKEWKPPGKKVIERAAANARQVAICLDGGELVYFELDAAGSLVQAGSKDLGVSVVCLDLGEVPHGRLRSSFLAVGGTDNSVRVLGLEPGDNHLLELASMQLPARAESIAFAELTLSTLLRDQR